MRGSTIQRNKLAGSQYLWLALPLLAAVYSIARVFPILPTVMQDEYVYSMESRHIALSEILHPNYLFSFLYGSTNVCGNDFYGCAKGLNSLFFLGTIAIVWLIGKQLFGFAAANLASTATALSPISLYVSFFMPDSMYYFFVILSFYLALRAAQNSTLINWSFVAISIGLAALVKPHAVLVFPAFLIFAALVIRKSERTSWLGLLGRQLGLVAVFFAVKFGLGFIFAGSAGLSLFGRNYTGALNKFATDSSKLNEVPIPQNTQNQVLLPSPDAQVSPPTETADFFAVFFSQLLGQYSLVLLLAGLPLLLGIRVLKRALSEREPLGQQSAFVILVALATAVMIPAVAGFQAITATLGENTGERLISRHYEFLIPLFILVGFSLMRFVEPETKSRIVQSSVVVFATIYTLVWLPSSIVPKFADSSSLMGLLSNPVALPLVCLVILGGVGYWLVVPENASKAIAWAVIPIVMVSAGLLGQEKLYSNIGTEKAFFDVAGEVSKPLLAGVPGEEIAVVGINRPAVYTAKFWIDKAGLADFIIAEEGQDVSSLISELSYALILGSSTVSIPHDVLAADSQYQLVRLIK